MTSLLLSLLVLGQPPGKVLLLPLEHRSLPAHVVESLEIGLRTEAAAVLDDHALLPRPALDLGGLTIAAGCATLDGPCLAGLAGSLEARVLAVRVDGEALEIVVADREAAIPYAATVHPVDEDSIPELRWHLARALGAARPPPPAALSLSPPAPPEAELWLDGRPVPPEALEDVGAGPHALEIRQPGSIPVVWSGTARRGRTVVVPNHPVPVEIRVEEPPSPELTHFWWLGGAAALTLGVVVPVLGLEVQAQEAEVARLNLSCTPGTGPLAPACQEGFDRATRTNVALGVGLSLLAAAGIAFFAEGGPSAAGRLFAGPYAGPSGGGLAVAGTY